MGWYTNNPCRNCEERHASCHPECERYKDWKEELNKKKKIRQEVLNKEDNIVRFKKLSNDRIMKRGGKK